jgi:hypothetical protein
VSAAEPENTVTGLFGGNSEGYCRMEEWLAVMCLGCRHERVSDRAAGIGGGSGCELVSRAVADPYGAEMPEWSRDAAPKPGRLAELGPGPWPACMSHEARKKRSDAGSRRAPKDMEPLFELTGAA